MGTIKHICGQCTESFHNETEYLKHRCPVLGGTPVMPEFTASKKNTPSPFEKKILTAVYTARQEKRNDNT